jgi:hypothetical protein
MDGAMRLETASQLRTEVQVTTSVSVSNSEKTLSVHVTAAKVQDGSWVELDIYGTSAPGQKLPQTPDIAQAGIGPDTNGDINDTFDVPLPQKATNSISIQATTCPTGNTSDTIASRDDCNEKPSQLTILYPASTGASA